MYEEYFLSTLRSKLDASIDNYEYLLARYLNDLSVDLRGRWEVQWRNIGFDIPQSGDLRRSAFHNVIKSVIDSVVSKLYNKKVRSYFTPIRGDWHTKRVVQSIQTYFDILFDQKNINKVVSDTFRKACVFGKGYIYVNPITYEISSLAPHMVAVLSSEARYSKPTMALIRYINFPSKDLKDYDIDPPQEPYCFLEVLYDTNNKKASFFINNTFVKSIDYPHDVLPLLPIYYNEPVFGDATTGLVQELDGIQTQIDILDAKMSASIQLSSTTQTFVLEGSNMSPKDLDNLAGTVYGVKMLPGMGQLPVVSVQQRPMDPMYSQLLKEKISEAYQMAGISELSSQSLKPAGLDSGIGLQTLEDIESDRFETQTTHYIHSFVELTKLLIEFLDGDVLPRSLNTTPLTWKDVKKQVGLCKIQFSAATMLSKDPSENIKMVMQLSQIGQIPTYKLARALNNPDLSEVYAGATAIHDGVLQVITDAIEKGIYAIPDFVEYSVLAQEISVTENQLYATLTGDEKKDKDTNTALQHLYKLEAELLEVMQTNGFVEQDETPQITTEEGLGIAPSTNKVADITTEVSPDVETTTDDIDGEKDITNKGDVDGVA